MAPARYVPPPPTRYGSLTSQAKTSAPNGPAGQRPTVHLPPPTRYGQPAVQPKRSDAAAGPRPMPLPGPPPPAAMAHARTQYRQGGAGRPESAGSLVQQKLAAPPPHLRFSARQGVIQRASASQQTTTSSTSQSSDFIGLPFRKFMKYAEKFGALGTMTEVGKDMNLLEYDRPVPPTEAGLFTDHMDPCITVVLSTALYRTPNGYSATPQDGAVPARLNTMLHSFRDQSAGAIINNLTEAMELKAGIDFSELESSSKFYVVGGNSDAFSKSKGEDLISQLQKWNYQIGGSGLTTDIAPFQRTKAMMVTPGGTVAYSVFTGDDRQNYNERKIRRAQRQTLSPSLMERRRKRKIREKLLDYQRRGVTITEALKKRIEETTTGE